MAIDIEMKSGKPMKFFDTSAKKNYRVKEAYNTAFEASQRAGIWILSFLTSRIFYQFDSDIDSIEQIQSFSTKMINHFSGAETFFSSH